MTDRRDTTVTSEKLGLYGIIIGLVGIATAYLAFGLAQLKLFEAYLPYIFIFIGVVYILLSVVLINSIKRMSGQQSYAYRGGPGESGGPGKLFHGIEALVVGILNKIKFFFHFLNPYKLPIFIGIAFISGVFITMTVTSGSAFPAFNFTLPSIQLPSLGNQSAASGTIFQFETKKLPSSLDFSASKEGNEYSISFSVVDQDGGKLNTSGNVSLKITDESNTILYEDDFEVTEGNYSELVYSTTVDASDLKKSKTSSGKVTLSFNPSEGNDLTNSTSVDVPVLSPVELEALYEKDYSESAILVGESSPKYAFDVTLVKMGYFTKLDGDTEKVYYRVDLRIKNMFAVESEFKTSASRLTIGGTSYTPDAASTIKTEKIKGGQTKEGYLLFKDAPSSMSGTVRIRAGTTTANEEVEYTFDVTL